MIQNYIYKQGSQPYNSAKSLVDAIGFELPRNWDCVDEMSRKAYEADAFMRNKVSYAHLAVIGLYETYTPHMTVPMLDVVWYCAASAYRNPIKNMHCIARMYTGFDLPFAVGVGTSLAVSRKPGNLESFLNACHDLGAFIPESSVTYLPDIAVALVLARKQVLADKGVAGASEMPHTFIVSLTVD